MCKQNWWPSLPLRNPKFMTLVSIHDVSIKNVVIWCFFLMRKQLMWPSLLLVATAKVQLVGEGHCRNPFIIISLFLSGNYRIQPKANNLVVVHSLCCNYKLACFAKWNYSYNIIAIAKFQCTYSYATRCNVSMTLILIINLRRYDIVIWL